MGKVGQQQRTYKPLFGSREGPNMERYVTRTQLMTSNTPSDPSVGMDIPMGAENTVNLSTVAQGPNLDSSTPREILTPDILDAKLDAKLQLLLQQITNNVSLEVNKLATELRGEIDQIGERTDTLENKFDEMINYVQAIEEENHNLRLSVSQLQLQQEDLENRERRQNLRFRGIPETVGDSDLRTYLLGLFNTLAPTVVDIDWRLDRAHRSLAPRPPAGARPRDVIVKFHYFESKETLIIATRNKPHLTYKGAKLQIFSDLSPITLAKRRSLRPITLHLQHHKIPYYWGFPFRLTVSKDGVQHTLRELLEGEAFLKSLGLPPLPEEDLIPPNNQARPPPNTPSRIWTPVRDRSRKHFSTPQRLRNSKQPP